MPVFELQFDVGEMAGLIARYDDPREPAAIASGNSAHARGNYTMSEFIAVVAWKTRGRQVPRALTNTEGRTVETTGVALSAEDEHLRIGALRTLDGVEWPTASALLHLAHTDRYPVLDFRALESLGVAQPKHFTHEFWAAYVGHCRGLADQTGLTMRDLDRALWQWSYEN